MKFVKSIALILLVAFVGIQFVPTERNQSDVVVPKTDFMLINDVPKDIKNKLQVQPGAWFMENHIKEGKAELNFNEWDSLSNRRKKSKLKSIISQIKDDNMPLSSYTLIHRNTMFSENEKKEIIKYLTELKNNL
jgi:hypothetical protein